MNCNNLLIEYINTIPYNEPIFFEEIKQYFFNILGNEANNIIKSLYVYINRLVKKHILVQYLKGIYYRPKKGVFGDKVLNINKVINKKYIFDNKGYKGYYYGPTLFNKLGLTTQVPKNVYIVTNDCPNSNLYYNKNLGVIIKKSVIKIDDNNYKYLQLFDVLINKDNISVEVDNEKEIIYKYIKDNKLEMAKIFEYAKLTKNIKAIEKLYEMG